MSGTIQISSTTARRRDDQRAYSALERGCGHGLALDRGELVTQLCHALLELAGALLELGQMSPHHHRSASGQFPGGALLIDTLGMRELHLGDHDAGQSELRSAVEAIACRCRFTDCCKEDLGEALCEEQRWKRSHMRRKLWGEEER